MAVTQKASDFIGAGFTFLDCHAGRQSKWVEMQDRETCELLPKGTWKICESGESAKGGVFFVKIPL